MKAIVYEQYGPPDVLELRDVPTPVPTDDEVLVRVHAASINSWDWDLLTGTPRVFRLWGLFKPKYQIPGADIAGRIEAVGAEVSQFKPGDEVFGDLSGYGWGGFAEYVCAKESAVALKSAGMSFEQAAAVPQAGTLALQGLRDHRPIEEGQRVLINGAGGGGGTFAVQMAKTAGAEVTGVDSAGKLELLRSLGADHVIDYAQQDFTLTGQQYDFILEIFARRAPSDYARALNPDGLLVVAGGTPGRILKLALLGRWFSMTASKKMQILMHSANQTDLGLLNQQFEAGDVTPVIGRTYPLSETADAFRYFASGEMHGKVVITM